MKNLQDATEKICDLKGSVMAIEALMDALLRVLPLDALRALAVEYDREVEAMQTVLLNASVSEHTLAAAERDVQRASSILNARLG
jgi:hypothetical protein